MNLYPPRVKRTHTCRGALALMTAYEEHNPTPENAPVVTVCGRIRRVNLTGKVSFMHIEDETGRIQLFLRINDMDKAVYNRVTDKLIDMDDFVQATGQLMRTKAGEISVRVYELVLLA
ncbi:MAG: lysine--tRNA ligase, partial [Phototrophicales bacterium]